MIYKIPNKTFFDNVFDSFFLGVPGVHWRDPDLHEVIEFLNNPNNVIKANAAAYLQVFPYFVFSKLVKTCINLSNLVQTSQNMSKLVY